MGHFCLVKKGNKLKSSVDAARAKAPKRVRRTKKRGAFEKAAKEQTKRVCDLQPLDGQLQIPPSPLFRIMGKSV